MDNIKKTNIDDLVNNKELNILKAIFPLMPGNIKKFLVIYIAMKDISNAFLLLKLAGNNTSFSDSSNELDYTKIFDCTKKFLDPSEVESIEGYLNVINVMKMYNEMSSMFQSDETQDDSSQGFNMDILKSMLTPEQSAIFDALSNSE